MCDRTSNSVMDGTGCERKTSRVHLFGVCSLESIQFSGEYFMQYFLKYLSTAPVILTAWLVFTAGILIEFNRFFPDLLFHPMP